MRLLEQAKADGYGVWIDHYRVAGDGHEVANPGRNAERLPLFPTGGRTVVRVTKNGIETIGEARCSLLDNYNKRLGVEIALGRALKQFTR